MTLKSRYEQRGVSTAKTDVHNAVRNLQKGIFSNCFCKILPDIAGGDERYCNIMHADTAGTKTALAYIYWKETADLSVWKGIVQDAIVMNLDDMLCAGVEDNIIFSSTIGRNKRYINADVIKAIIEGTQEYLEMLGNYGINCFLAGGETADVGDIVRTIDVGFTAFARMKKCNVIENHILSGDVVIGLASSGKTDYENDYNSGISSNGLTSARHDLFGKWLAKKYPESYDPMMEDRLVYSGNKILTDLDPISGMTFGKLLLSPTRTYSPVIKKIFENNRSNIHGMIHCTGGGQTKALNFISSIHIIKDDLFEIPHIFKIIQQESGASWEEMHRVFNMGHRMEIYVAKEHAQSIIKIAHDFGVDAKVVGRCEQFKGKRVTIKSPNGTFTY